MDIRKSKIRLILIIMVILISGCMGAVKQNSAIDGRGQEAPNFTVTPSQVDFGVVTENNQSIGVLTIANMGDTSFTVSNIYLTDTSVFTVDTTIGSNPIGSVPTTINAGEFKTFGVIFSPSNATHFSGDLIIEIVSTGLQITSQSTYNISVPLSGDGVVTPVPDISITPQPIDFGSVLAGNTASKVVEIRNNGSSVLQVSDIKLKIQDFFSLDLDGGKTPVHSLPVNINPGKKKTFSVIFSPSSQGNFSDELIVLSDDPDTAEERILIEGVADLSAVPNISVDPVYWDFGSIIVGNNASKEVVISNTGTGALTVNDIVLGDTVNYAVDLSGGSNPITSVPSAIEPSGQRTFTVTFSPKSEGSMISDIKLFSDDPDSPETTFSVSGVGILDTGPRISVTPATIDFGTVGNGDVSGRIITISNSGTSDLVVSDMVLSETTNFALDTGGGSNPCGTKSPVIPGGSSCTVRVTFSPIVTGNISSSLLITSNDSSNNPLTVSMSGAGYGGGSSFPFVVEPYNQAGNYPDPSPYPSMPAKGESYTDPDFHGTMTRVTDRHEVNESECYPEYARFTIISSDGKYLITNGWYIYNLQTGDFVKEIPHVSSTPYSYGCDVQPDFRWDYTGNNPSLLYYHYGTKLYSLDVETDETKLIHDFADDIPEISIIDMKDEGDSSADSRYWAFVGMKSNCNDYALITYDKETDQVIGKKIVNWGSDSVDFVDVAPDGGKVLVMRKWGDGIYFYDKDLSNSIKFGDYNFHSGWAYDQNGQSVLVGVNEYDDLVYVDPNTGQSTTIMGYADFGSWNVGFHFARIYKPEQKGWLLVSVEDDKSSAWSSNQILMVEVKPKSQVPRVWRVTHSMNIQKDYYDIPFAGLDIWGKKLFWSANFGNSSQNEIFLMNLPDNWWVEISR